jgi:hypothetical protein
VTLRSLGPLWTLTTFLALGLTALLLALTRRLYRLSPSLFLSAIRRLHRFSALCSLNPRLDSLRLFRRGCFAWHVTHRLWRCLLHRLRTARLFLLRGSLFARTSAERQAGRFSVATHAGLHNNSLRWLRSGLLNCRFG